MELLGLPWTTNTGTVQKHPKQTCFVDYTVITILNHSACVLTLMQGPVIQPGIKPECSKITFTECNLRRKRNNIANSKGFSQHFKLVTSLLSMLSSGITELSKYILKTLWTTDLILGRECSSDFWDWSSTFFYGLADWTAFRKSNNIASMKH